MAVSATKLVILLCLAGTTYGASAQPRQRLRIMEYNVENLFDTIPSPNHLDADFTPEGTMHWNTPRYWAKLTRLSRTIASAGYEGTPPALIALVEVENDSVVHHLAHRTRLARWDYAYCISHSSDVRGINVALMYQPRWFRLLAVNTLRILPPQAKMRQSRDVMHAMGLLPTADTLDVMICHWPSRKGGKAAEAYRMRVAQKVRSYADSLIHVRQRAQLVITGDFNAYYPEKAFTAGLRVHPLAANRMACTDSLYLTSYGLKARHGIKGTYKFQGEWNQLDQFIVNGGLLGAGYTRWIVTREGCRIVDFPFLLEGADSENGPRPYRTYLGSYYHGGFSDHLPLVIDLEMR